MPRRCHGVFAFPSCPTLPGANLPSEQRRQASSPERAGKRAPLDLAASAPAGRRQLDEAYGLRPPLRQELKALLAAGQRRGWLRPFRCAGRGEGLSQNWWTRKGVPADPSVPWPTTRLVPYESAFAGTTFRSFMELLLPRSPVALPAGATGVPRGRHRCAGASSPGRSSPGTEGGSRGGVFDLKA